jgi:serine/threonine-protein kinase
MVLAATQVAGLLRVGADGGAPRPLTQLDVARGETSHRWPQVLPGGRWVLFTVGIDGAGYDDAQLDAVSLASGERRRLWTGGSHGRYAAGHLFFAQAGRLFAVPLDLDTLTVGGTPRVMVEGISDDPRNGAAHFAVAEDGPLVYGPGPARSAENYLSWVDAAGNLTRIGDTPRRFRQPSVSPDGRRVAAVIGVGSDSWLWVIDTETATLTRAAVGGGWHHPIWTPDSKSITVAAEHDGRWRIVTLTPGTRPAETLLEGPNRAYPNAWSADRRSLIFQERRPESGWDLRILDVGAEGRPAGEARDLVATPFQEANASLSADGRFFAYESDELDNSFGSYFAPVANPAARRRAAAATLRSPRWGRGRDLYCWFPIGGRPAENPGPEGVHRIEWRGEGVPAGTVPLWTDPRHSGPLLRRLTVAAYASYDVDVSDRGPRFLVLETSAPTTAAPLQRPVVVFNWQRELQAREAASR